MKIEGRHFGIAAIIFLGIAAMVSLLIAINSVPEEDEIEINNRPKLLSKKNVDGYYFRKLYEPEFNRFCYSYYDGLHCFIVTDSIKQHLDTTYEIK